MSLIDWLRLGRPHTASLTIPGALLGVAVAGGGPWWAWLLVAVWALAYHYVGFAHNGFEDLPWDREDPSKAHFPLVSGAIRPATAQGVIYIGILAVFLAGWGLGGFTIPVLICAGAVTLFGVAYNRQCKLSLWAPLYISLAFAYIPLYGYFAAGGAYPMSIMAWLLFAYGFAMMSFQIAVSGYLKELAQTDQPNLLRRTGWDLKLFFRMSEGPRLEAGFPWPYLARLPCVVLAVVIAFWVGPSWWVYSTVPLGITVLVVTNLELEAGPWDRPRRVRLMAVNEILTYWLLVVAMAPLLGWSTVAFVVFPLLWFVAWNRILWGTLVAPKV